MGCVTEGKSTSKVEESSSSSLEVSSSVDNISFSSLQSSVGSSRENPRVLGLFLFGDFFKFCAHEFKCLHHPIGGSSNWGSFWTKENLNILTPHSRCYEDLEENCETKGRLYNRGEALQSASRGGVCPAIRIGPNFGMKMEIHRLTRPLVFGM